jgi:hypothetical protein
MASRNRRRKGGYNRALGGSVDHVCKAPEHGWRRAMRDMPSRVTQSSGFGKTAKGKGVLPLARRCGIGKMASPFPAIWTYAMRFASFACLPLLFALAACQSGGAPAPSASAVPAPSSGPAGVTPAGFSLPSGGGCAGEAARFQAVMDNDLSTGHTTKGVWDQVSAQIAQARATCAAGNEGAGLAQLRATKTRFGYP